MKYKVKVNSFKMWEKVMISRKIDHVFLKRQPYGDNSIGKELYIKLRWTEWAHQKGDEEVNVSDFKLGQWKLSSLKNR